MKRASALILPLLLAACAPTVEGERWEPFSLTPNTPVLALGSPAGAVIGFSEQRTPSTVMQTTVFAADADTPGQNELVVTVYRKGLAPRISQPQIVEEMARRIPGVPMRIANTLLSNGMGPLGYAVGRRGRLACVYAWQSLDNADEAVTGSTASLLAPRHALTLRLRLCRNGVPAASLLAVAQSLHPVGVGASLAPPIATGGYDALSAATGLGGAPGTLVDPVLAETEPAPRRRVRRPQAVAAPLDMPAVPLPLLAQPAAPAASVPAAGVPSMPMPTVPMPAGPAPGPAVPRPQPALPMPQPAMAPAPAAGAVMPVVPLPR